MATQEELDIQNKASLKRQRQTREFNKARRSLKDQRNEALQGARGTKERREIKEAYEGAVHDLTTSYEPRENKTDYESDIGQRGIDQFTAPESTPQDDSGSGGGIPDGFEEETLDVVEDDNTAGQRVFLTKEVP